MGVMSTSRNVRMLCRTRLAIKCFPLCVAPDNKAFFVISMSENGAHIYELVAQTVSEKNV